MTNPPRRFSVAPASPIERVVFDQDLPPGHPSRVLARVWQVDEDEYEVTWMRDLALRRTYGSVDEVLDDLERTASRRDKPLRIAHRPPTPLAG